MSARLDQALALARSQGRAALATYLPVGYPNRADSMDALHLLAQASDVVELGVPHVAPVLDGPVIRRASAQALAGGFRMQDLITAARELSAASATALLVMSYWHPISRYGPERFADDLAAAGGAGVLVPDLPAEEAGRWIAAARAAGLHTVNLVDPRADVAALARVCAASSGMVYAAATQGVTGTQGPLSARLPQLVARLRTITSLPVGVGIGVSAPGQAAIISAFADAVVVGSAVIRRMEAAPKAPVAAAASVAREFADGVRHPVGAAA
ncbi:tryptophan synthase subunit alpha [Streptomyces sp. NPDC058247]|uniref:tryptophan synthase subunit alpha n=1 Tax=Streptomyces sp. NPDC058247 TaxID=3346401 RepID=UPI0036E94968